MMYSVNDIVSIAKRENNTKRSYLIVNKLQSKHVPVSPEKTLTMLSQLYDKFKNNFDPEKTLLVGFAETATAIGSYLALRLGCRYIQTTREDIEGAEYIAFTESHSHATAQRIVKNGIEKVIDNISDIIFAEDELTTGNTILKAAAAVNAAFPGKKLRYSAVSVLNCMGEPELLRYKTEGIDLYYLLKVQNSSFPEIADSYRKTGVYHLPELTQGDCVQQYTISGRINPRLITDASAYRQAIDSLAKQAALLIKASDRSVLVIGTEEFMYPAIKCAEFIEKKGISALCHSTTRSPIEVYLDEGYPLRERYELLSLYDDSRKTFIYDLKKHDRVIIITDSDNKGRGEKTLISALKSAGNDNIILVRWTK